VQNTLEFPDLLRLIDERSTAFGAAVASAPSLDVQVPTCPEWTLSDLVHHMGEGRFDWAATVAAGPDASAKSSAEGAPPAPGDRDAQLGWLASSTQQLVGALQEAGPDRGCWTWWGDSQSPQTCHSVARHQLQQYAVHTYDAQVTVGAPQPLPDDVALDGVDEFLSTCCATTSAWPHEPAVVDYHASEGHSWRQRLSAEGSQITRLPAPGTVDAAAAGTDQDAADASARGTANELVLALYGRIPMDALELAGDPGLFDLLIAWDPSE
jgi:uncharacterized protein (TIGR03083 family)